MKETEKSSTLAASATTTPDTIAILDFGAQYSQLIARRVREVDTYSELLPFNTSAEKLKSLNPKGIILSGGPSSVYEAGAPQLDPEIWKMGVPVLGICYGMQLMARDLGGSVQSAKVKEFGRALLTITRPGKLFADLDPAIESWMSHGDSVCSLPPGFAAVASTTATPVAAIANDEQSYYGVQFHPEVAHTRGGQQIIRNFVVDICKSKQNWTMSRFVDQTIEDVRVRAGGKRVLLALSGGVDSSTLAFLLHKAIGDKLTCMFIDQGFMRKNEPESKRLNVILRFGFISSKRAIAFSISWSVSQIRKRSGKSLAPNLFEFLKRNQKNSDPSTILLRVLSTRT
jgi:GMP synthase (glutamine-hydrolysing)